jgi:hypothetical protein
VADIDVLGATPLLISKTAVPSPKSTTRLPIPPLYPCRHALPRFRTSHEHLIHLITIVSLRTRRGALPRRPHTAVVTQTVQLVIRSTDIEFSHSQRKDNFELDISQFLTDAVPRPLFKGPVGVGNEFVEVFAEEALRFEFVGVRAPIFGVALYTGEDGPYYLCM